jgi:hypothetical protein
MRIIDIHTHAFPDALADRAMSFLEEAHIKGALDGRVSSLLGSMDKAGIERSLVCSIATKPSQFKPIIEWSKQIASDRIVPFPSVHPDDPNAAAEVAEIHAAGLKGVKLHPYYQHFTMDEPRIDPVYAAIQEHNLLLLCHTGFDMAYPRDRICDPVKIMAVLGRFPRLRMITSHLGAWNDWDEVRRLMLGKRVLIETSYSLHVLGKDASRDLILSHPPDCLFFGTDSPWADQSTAVEEIRDLDLPEELERAILYDNAARLLDSAGKG